MNKYFYQGGGELQDPTKPYHPLLNRYKQRIDPTLLKTNVPSLQMSQQVIQQKSAVKPSYNIPAAHSESSVQKPLLLNGQKEDNQKNRIRQDIQSNMVNSVGSQPTMSQGRTSTPLENANTLQLNQNFVNSHPYTKLVDGKVTPVNVDRDFEGKGFANTRAAKNDEGMTTLANGLDATAMLTGAGEVLSPLAKLAKRALIKSAEEGVLSNVHKLNPFAFKPKSDNLYRQIGDGVDALESKVIRSADTKSFPRPYFVEGKDFEMLGTTGAGATNKGNIIAEMPMVKNGEMTAFQNKVGKAYSPYQANLSEIPLNEVKLYKPNWLQRYKQIKTPLQNSIQTGLSEAAPLINTAKSLPTNALQTAAKNGMGAERINQELGLYHIANNTSMIKENVDGVLDSNKSFTDRLASGVYLGMDALIAGKVGRVNKFGMKQTLKKTLVDNLSNPLSHFNQAGARFMLPINIGLEGAQYGLNRYQANTSGKTIEQLTSEIDDLKYKIKTLNNK